MPDADRRADASPAASATQVDRTDLVDCRDVTKLPQIEVPPIVAETGLEDDGLLDLGEDTLEGFIVDVVDDETVELDKVDGAELRQDTDTIIVPWLGRARRTTRIKRYVRADLAAAIAAGGLPPHVRFIDLDLRMTLPRAHQLHGRRMLGWESRAVEIVIIVGGRVIRKIVRRMIRLIVNSAP